MPSASMLRRTRSGWPVAATPGSVTSSARVTPRRLSSQPASAAAPGPNLIGVASSGKTDSCSRVALIVRSYPRGDASVPGVTNRLVQELAATLGSAHVLADD